MLLVAGGWDTPNYSFVSSVETLRLGEAFLISRSAQGGSHLRWGEEELLVDSRSSFLLTKAPYLSCNAGSLLIHRGIA